MIHIFIFFSYNVFYLSSKSKTNAEENKNNRNVIMIIIKD